MPLGYAIYRNLKITKNENDVADKLKEQTPKAVDYECKINVADSSQKGYILLDAYDGAPNYSAGFLIITDFSGRQIFKKRIDRPVGNFRQWHIGNKVYYSYSTDDTEAYHNKKSPSHLSNGHTVILDSALQFVQEVHLVPHDDINRDNKNDLDPHDFIMLGENHFITLANSEKHVDNIPAALHPAANVKVQACIIQEVADGKVLWQWDATHYPELYTTSTESNNFSTDTVFQDYAHFNALIIDPRDSNLLISFRSLNQVIKISRKTGDIIWRLGGKNSDFPLSGNQKFIHQHGIVLIDDNRTLMMLDNGDFKKRPYSRVLEFKLDEKNKKILSFSAYKIPHLFDPAQGNIAKIRDRYLIDGGIGNYLLLVDPKTNKYEMEMKENLPSYRAYKVDSLYGLEKILQKK